MMTFKTVAACVLAFAVAFSTAPAYAATAAERETAVAHHSNVQRKAHDRKTVTRNACLQKYARAWAKHIAVEKKALVHRSSASLVAIMKNCDFYSIGENLAEGQPTGKSVVSAWMKSSGHRANLLNPGFRHVGIGAYKYKGKWWTVQLLAGR